MDKSNRSERLDEPVSIPSHKALRMRGNVNASRGYPSKKNLARFPETDGWPLLCDTCPYSSKCREYQPAAVCTFRKEVSGFGTRNLDDVIAELSELCQVQKARVQMGMTFEVIAQGGLIDRQTGREVERQRRLLVLLAKLRRERLAAGEGLRSDGLLAKLFGSDGTLEDLTSIG